jgi:hypothetical protein
MRAWLRRWSARADRVALWGTRVLLSRGLRSLWLVGASFAAVLALAFGTLQAASLVAHEERDEVTTVDADEVASVAVDNGAGSVTLIGVDGRDEITVRAHISDGLRATGHRVVERDDILFVRGSCPVFGSEWCSVDYTIEMPSDMYASVTGRGGVSATDLDGGLRARSKSSRVDLLRVGGDLTVETDQGSVEGDDLRAGSVVASTDQGSLRLTFVTSPDEVRTEADQGSIDIVLPDEPGVYYADDLHSDQGSENISIRTRSDSDRPLIAETDQGSITVGYADR